MLRKCRISGALRLGTRRAKWAAKIKEGLLRVKGSNDVSVTVKEGKCTSERDPETSPPPVPRSSFTVKGLEKNGPCTLHVTAKVEGKTKTHVMYIKR